MYLLYKLSISRFQLYSGNFMNSFLLSVNSSFMISYWIFHTKEAIVLVYVSDPSRFWIIYNKQLFLNYSIHTIHSKNLIPNEYVLSKNNINDPLSSNPHCFLVQSTMPGMARRREKSNYWPYSLAMCTCQLAESSSGVR